MMGDELGCLATTRYALNVQTVEASTRTDAENINKGDYLHDLFLR